MAGLYAILLDIPRYFTECYFMRFTEKEINDAIVRTKIAQDVALISQRRHQQSFDNATRVSTKIYKYMAITRITYAELPTLLCFFKGADSLKSFTNRHIIVSDKTLALLEDAIDLLLADLADGILPDNINPESEAF